LAQDDSRLTEAISQYIMAWRFDPDSEDSAFAGIAIILHHEDKPKLAALYYQKAVEKKSRLPFVYEDYGIDLVKLSRLDEALEQFSAAVQLDATSAEPHFLMGKCLLQLGRDAEAVAQFHAALQLDPDNLEMLLFTANVRAADEDTHVRDGAEARTIGEKLVQLTGSQQPAALEAKAMACAENGQFDEAVQIQQRAVKLIEATGPKENIAAMRISAGTLPEAPAVAGILQEDAHARKVEPAMI
jgi:Tfp pilus assembly protein PilF